MSKLFTNKEGGTKNVFRVFSLRIQLAITPPFLPPGRPIFRASSQVDEFSAPVAHSRSSGFEGHSSTPSREQSVH